MLLLGASFREMKRWRSFLPLVSAFLCFAFYAALLPSLYARPRPHSSPEMEVALPRFVQVLMAVGDRYLAANLAGFRALVASTEKMTADNYHILGIVQSDLAWLNPAHEDNYYIAAAILPWSQEVDAAQEILRRASKARPFDWNPAFYYAFNTMHFKKDPVEGARWLQIAAGQASDEIEKTQLQQLAAQWASRGEDKHLAIRIHRTLAQETHNPAFARFLERRAQRLENVLALETAVALFREHAGRSPKRLEELVEQELIQSLPKDPFGLPYAIDAKGEVVVLAPNAAASRKAP